MLFELYKHHTQIRYSLYDHLNRTADIPLFLVRGTAVPLGMIVRQRDSLVQGVAQQVGRSLPPSVLWYVRLL